MNNTIRTHNDAKEIFKKCGTCSRTFAHILNREFDEVQINEEIALNPLAGGIMNQGHQCGMLWGSSLAIGAAAFRKFEDSEKAMYVAIKATQNIIQSFVETSGATNCKDLIGYDLTSVLGMAKFMIKTTLKGMKNTYCFNLAEEWAPKAIEVAENALSQGNDNTISPVNSCASQVVRKMGGNDEQCTTVAGFAGGLGLTGNACGALSAAIWMKMLDWCKANPEKKPPFFNNPTAKKILKRFKETTGNIMLCSEICGRKFKSVEDHTEYLNEGGCKELIDKLSKVQKVLL
ncbi:C-GCAxxG-C-C family protein [Spongiivirga citrea]|uniref:C_GCAxxG_C_C family protein n=1 Tax=Spongiivirga citrea TaxID=1481457 RepID=A0A6M0CFT7_9FLAO|nr:C-GCAxxG-C-C family protein [Spongiivirga citrea]NER15733.1 hypothetical protein [Spongiivirga citrea]